MSTLERLRGANPVPEPDRLLGAPDAMETFVLAVKERSGIVQGTHEHPTELDDRTTTAPGRGVWLMAAAAAATVVVVGIVAALLSVTTDPEPAAPTQAGQIAYVEAAYEALNAGDIDQWLAHFADDADTFGVSTEAIRNLYEVLAAANYRAQIVEACRHVDGAVACTITESNDFFAAGGLSTTRIETFSINDDGRIAAVSAELVETTPPGPHMFTQAFYDWLRDAHPEVHAEIRPMITTHLPQEPEHMRAALEYLDEFIAQSERYPVGG